MTNWGKIKNLYKVNSYTLNKQMKHGNYDVVLASWKAKLIITVNQKRDFILPLKTTNPPLILATHLLFLLIETYFYFDKK